MGEPFLEEKYNWLFRFFDTDGNGVLERKDFEDRAGRACQAVQQFFSQQPNTQELEQHMPRIQQAQYQAYGRLFDTLTQQITHGSQRISREDWLNFCRTVRNEVRRTGEMPHWFHDLLVYYFQNVLDFNSNGNIDFYEMTFMGDAPLELTWFCYDKLTEAKRVELDLNLFLEMTKRYMSVEDPNCKSRYMFGCVERPNPSQEPRR
ncbi:hypothetical protein ACOME3_010415 [Neoechinorhynchus agilis]